MRSSAGSARRTRRQAGGRKPKRVLVRPRRTRPVCSRSAPVLVIGVGNLARADDGVGVLAARKLKAAGLRGTEIVEASGESAGLMELWRGAESVILVDAIQSGARPGTIRRLDARNERVPAGLFHCSTHALGVAEAVELSRLLGQLPPHLVIYGVEGRRFGVGRRPTPVVAASVAEVARRVQREIESMPPRIRARAK